MRAILVDWLVEVQENFELYHETLYLAVKIVDNYLQKHKTPKELLQLVGATSLLIASKIEVCSSLVNLLFKNNGLSAVFPLKKMTFLGFVFLLN